MKRDIKGERLLTKKEVKEGPMGNFALPLPPADRKTGEGGGARRRPWGARRRPWGGGKGGEVLGEPVPPPRFGPEQSEEVGPRQRAASGSGTRSGGVGEQGGALVVAEVAVGRRSGAGGLFIGRMRWWGGAGQVVAAGERRSEP